MNNPKQKRKVLALSMVLAAMLICPASVSAQGLFGGPSTDEGYNGGQSMLSPGNRGGVGLGNATQNYPTTDPLGMGTGFGGANQENPTPIGGGIVVLMAAGASYVLLKKKGEKQ